MERVLDYTVATGEPGTAASLDAACLRSECRRLEHLLAGYQAYLGHDLANQLVAIQGFARHLEELAGGLHPDAALLLARLADVSRRADQSSRRLAEIGRALRDPPHGGAVALLGVARAAAASIRSGPRRGAGPAAPMIEVRAPMPTVRLSERLLYLVLVELLHNAAAALPVDRPAAVAVSADRLGDACVLTVRDEGQGFREAALARIGEPGFISPTSHAQALGYFLILQAVARWCGRLTIHSEPGRGTTVVLMLPQAAVRPDGGDGPQP